MSQTVGIAQFVRQPSDLGECLAGTDLIGRGEVQAFLGSITGVDAATAELAASLETGDVFRAGMTAFVCGVLVERGGSAAVPVDAVMRVTERYLHLAEEFAARGGASAQDEVFRVSPDLVRAHHALPFVLLAAMTMLSRDAGARQRLRARPDVARLADELEEHYETLYYVREVLALLDDREILLLDPRGRRGFVLGLTGVQDRMYHVFALAQDALERHAGPGYLGAEAADPALARYARNQALTPQEHQEAPELIDYLRIGFHYPGAGAAPASFFPGSAPFEAVPVLDGLPTLFLAERSINAQWSPANMYPALHEALEAKAGLRELPRDDVQARLAAFAAASG